MKSIKIPNRIHHFYENILRYDLLLKLDCTNILEVPQLNRAIVLANQVPPNNQKNASLALEILSGQKASNAAIPISADLYAQKSNKRSKTARLVLNKKSSLIEFSKSHQISQALYTFCSLRSSSMYHFLDKFLGCASHLTLGDTGVSFEKVQNMLTSRSSHDSKIQIHGQEMNFTLNNRELRLFPEIPNHFEFFEHIPTVQIKLISSTKNKNATLLLWTGLQQKEI